MEALVREDRSSARGVGEAAAASRSSAAWVRLAALLAAAPIAVAAGRAIAWGWAPVGDEGVIAARSFDVLSTKPPLLGQFSQFSAVTGQPTYSPGPLPYWVLALPAHLGPAALIATTAALNAASVAATVILARHRAGAAFALAVALGLLLVTASLSQEAAYGIWNPYAVLFPFTLMLFVAWSVACGDLRLLPPLVLLATFVVQGHLSYLAPTLCALGVAAAGAVLVWRRSAGRSTPDPGALPAWSPRRWVLIAALAGLVAWSAPLAEQARHRPGNLILLARSFTSDHPTMGPRVGLHALERAMGVRPWWLRDGRRLNRSREAVVAPGVRTAATAAIVLGGVAVVLVLAIRRRRHDVVVASALGLLLSVSIFLSARSIPMEKANTLSYSLLWASPAGMFVWLTAAWGFWAVLDVRRRPSPRHARVAAGAALVLLGAGCGWLVATQRRSEGGLSLRYPWVGERVADAVPPDVTVSVHAQDERPGRVVVPAAAYALRRKGTRVTMPKAYADYFGARYQRSGAAPAFRLAVTTEDPGASRGSAGVVRVPPLAIITLRRPSGRAGGG